MTGWSEGGYLQSHNGVRVKVVRASIMMKKCNQQITKIYVISLVIDFFFLLILLVDVGKLCNTFFVFFRTFFSGIGVI